MTRAFLVAVGLVCGLTATMSACYPLGAKDIFEVPFAPLPAPRLAELSDAHHHVRPLRTPGAPSGSAYWDEGDGARGILLFFTGNGYGADAALRRLLVPARALGLDLVVFNYYDEGEPRPTMADVRRRGDALFDVASSLPTPASRTIYVAGHSLGATFALSTAADRAVSGLILVAPATTGVAMVRHQVPLARLVWLRPDSDYSQFNNLVLAPHVRAPTLVVGSTGDSRLPPAFTHAVIAALPRGIRKSEIILPGVSHAAYFASDGFWRAASAFFDLPVAGALVGTVGPP